MTAIVVDFLCTERRLIIEVVAASTPPSATPAAAYLESQGFRVIRFWNNDVLQIPTASAR